MKRDYLQITAILIGLLCFASCASIPELTTISETPEIDYGSLDNWSAHPGKDDTADLIPNMLNERSKTDLPADVFFVHPTTYSGKSKSGYRNALINNERLNNSTDKYAIKLQASIFNKAGNIYAPRYRQAHLSTYYEDDKEIANDVFDRAYWDVKAAFEYYLKNYNEGKPIIIASHSQGTNHTTRLLKEFFDGKELEDKLVAAYLIGMPIAENTFESIQPCEHESETGCFISWRTFKKGYVPKDRITGPEIVVINPLSWNREKTLVSKEQNDGAVLRNFDKVLNHATDAQIKDGYLWASKPKFPFSFLFSRKNYHILDLNLFYVNIRNNADVRVRSFLDRG